MAYEERDNSGSLFRNDRATTDKHPTHKGKARIGGVEYWVSGWVKEAGQNAKNPGQKFFSLAFEPCEKQEDIPFGNGSGQGQRAQDAPAAAQDDYQDDIPF
jgi:hypothetical protein